MRTIMYYFFYRTGCYDCVRISNLSSEMLRARTWCRFVPANCRCHTFYDPNCNNDNQFYFNNDFINFNNFENSPFNL